jgi:hypothetical protein
MQNYYDTQVNALKKNVGLPYSYRNDSSQLNIKRTERGVIYIMLSSGVILDQSEKDTPIVTYPRDVSNIPNQRLINQLSEFLTDIKIEHSRPTLAIGAGKHKVISIKRRSGANVQTVLIYSMPEHGRSYVKASVVGGYSQIDYTFIAHSRIQAFMKLKERGIICPKHSTCHTYCLDCPELRGGCGE